MRESNRWAAPALAAAVASLLTTALLPPRALALPQEEERQIRREIVVVGSQPAHRRLIHEKLANRGYLGVSLLGLTPELRQHFGASRQSGVLVSRVDKGSPAEAAGVAVGDVITSVDGEPVRATSQLVGRIGLRQEGDEVELGIVRDRAERTLTATLALSERRQVEIGQFVWHEEGPFVVDIDPETIGKGLVVDPGQIERVIAIDPETVNDSVSRLLERIKAEGGLPGIVQLDLEQRKALEKRIAELEDRLLEMERQLRRRIDD